jgi:mRNA interferase RelE/StbE
MKVEFDKSFYKSLDKIGNKTIFLRVEKFILNCEKAKSLNELHSIKKLTGFQNYYRVRIGKYRLGFEKTGSNTLRLIVITHRKDIYKIFP